MIRFPTLLAASAALFLTPAAMAKDDAAVSDTAPSAATPVKLVSWDGDFELIKESQRLRIWRTHLGFTLTVDAQGEVTGCELADAFRMPRINEKMCDILSEHHTFEPALDANGVPVEGSYSATMSYAEIRERL